MSLDLQMGVLATVVFMFILYIPQKLIDPEEFADAVMDGIKNMLMPLIMVVLAYSFGSASAEVGFIQYVIDLAMANVSPQMLPFTVFLVFGITEFIMGLSWECTSLQFLSYYRWRLQWMLILQSLLVLLLLQAYLVVISVSTQMQLF